MILSLNKLLELAIVASIKAGDEILKIYESDFEVEHKGDSSPLTLADRESHRRIVKELSTTQIPVLSEEGKEISYDERKGWSRLWIVDPLDGTKEFVKRNGEFTVNIALVETGVPVLGVIYVPVTRELYFGTTGRGSYKFSNANNSFMDIDNLIMASQKLPIISGRSRFTVVASRSHMGNETIQFIEELKEKHGEVEIISAGSSLKMCLVAEGKADVYPRFGPTMEWDTAAGQTIVESAGKTLLDISTRKPLMYNREILMNNSFVVR